MQDSKPPRDLFVARLKASQNVTFVTKSSSRWCLMGPASSLASASSLAKTPQVPVNTQWAVTSTWVKAHTALWNHVVCVAPEV